MANLLSNRDNIRNNDACLCVFLCIRALTLVQGIKLQVRMKRMIFHYGSGGLRFPLHFNNNTFYLFIYFLLI